MPVVTSARERKHASANVLKMVYPVVIATSTFLSWIVILAGFLQKMFLSWL